MTTMRSLAALSSMELTCVSPSRSLSSTLSSSSSSSSSLASLRFFSITQAKGNRSAAARCVRASAEGSGGERAIDADARGGTGGGGDHRRSSFASGIEVTSPSPTTAIDRSFAGDAAADLVVWEKLGAVVRLSYGIGIYGAMVLAGNFICSITGVDNTGGFHPSLKAIVDGLGYAAPPIMALLFILDDEVVKYSPHARAIRDVEDEELRSFFYGMSPWQFILIVIASSVGEELFYRVAVQGSLADMFLRGTDLVKDARGIASLSGMLPLLVPFAQAFAAVITAALTGSLYYIATAPKDPTYVVAPVLRSRSGREDLKKLFAAWYERRQMRKIYSPLLEGLLALYLGYEWIRTDNILAPMITHGIYSAVVLGHGLWKIHDHRRRLRNRIKQVRVGAKISNKL